jgi:hypothetical protein
MILMIYFSLINNKAAEVDSAMDFQNYELYCNA